jgi:protein-L-isoaspartate(D-aspartate) O-methyltransferase
VGHLADERRRLIEHLRAEGIRDERVLAAMARVPREAFVAREQAGAAYENGPLPIGECQTISQPFVVALMSEALGLGGGERVLEIGTGSGYQAAILAELAGYVVSVERHRSLHEGAARVLAGLGYRNVELHHADGTLGWPAGAPYYGILVAAAAPEVPRPLTAQLAMGGRLVLPVGTAAQQRLVLLVREPGGIAQHDLGPVRFVPLIGAEGWREAPEGE